ncbi:hypothetical protein [uncultured Cloacibacillus sp.]|uniref:hypothetical protein n=1 Tax=uncultured Cloacibacillus sp. TaxID=889794 RepID=UPI0025E0DE9E|nr:hypothetical protein [uncultured Cloacibacillus sp.]
MGILPESRRFWQAPARALKIQTFLIFQRRKKRAQSAARAVFYAKIAIFMI